MSFPAAIRSGLRGKKYFSPAAAAGSAESRREDFEKKLPKSYFRWKKRLRDNLRRLAAVACAVPRPFCAARNEKDVALGFFF